MQVITQSCVLFLWMHLLTFVETEDCTRQQFLSGELYDSNFDTSSLEASYPDGKQLRINCNIGYTGFFKLICNDGTWTHRGHKCQPRSCGHPGDAQFADFQLDKGEDFVFGSDVVYTCHKGYQMISRNNMRRCMAEGWDGVVPVCEALQCPVIRLQNNVLVTGDPEQANFGNVLRFSCKNNDEVLNGLVEIYCDVNGEWNSQPPICEEIKCLPPDISNGEVLGDITVYKHHHVLNFKCNDGYIKSDVGFSACVKQGRRADWSPTPTCKRVTCELPPKIEGTTYEPSFKSTFEPGGSVTVTCGEGHWVGQKQDTVVSTCQNSGKWDIEPLCKEVTCTAYDRHVSEWTREWRDYYYKIRLGDTRDYTCKAGYRKPPGVGRATCTRQGWSPDPLCQVKTCNRDDEPNTDIVSGIKPTYDFNEEVEYVCKGGYEGRFKKKCGDDRWYRLNYGTYHCTEKRCDRLNIPDAYIYYQRDKYSPGYRLQYTCENDPSKIVTLTCRYGKWNGPQSCSDPTKCGSPPIPHGFAVGPYNETKYYYTCNNGFKLNTKGWWGQAQCEDGTWTGIEECIDDKKCGPIPRIPNGKMTSVEKVYNEDRQIRIICATGYTAQLTHLTCIKGKWQSRGIRYHEICRRDARYCNTPPKVANAVALTSYEKEYPSDFVVTYQCRSNFTMVGENQIKCIDGEWNVTDIKCTDKCDRPVDDMQTMTFTDDKETYMNGEMIEYQCVKPSLKPGGNAMCINGKWNETIKCKDGTKCGPIPRIPNGRMFSELQEYIHGTNVEITCADGYTAQISHLTCWYGEWLSQVITRGQICQISGTAAPVRETEPVETTAPPTTHSSRPDDSTTNGRHDGKNCGPIPRISNGRMFSELQEYIHGTNVPITCEDGYTAQISHMTCWKGQWHSQRIRRNQLCQRSPQTQPTSSPQTE